jgi:hypothetical protein
MRKWATFLPVGKDFTIPARNFLAVGKGLQGSPAKETKRPDGRGRRTQPWLWPQYGQLDCSEPTGIASKTARSLHGALTGALSITGISASFVETTFN